MNTIENLFSNIKRIFSLFIGLISFVIGTVADEGADIVIRALPLATPMPNAISVFWVSQTTLGFSWWQALAFAATIEFSLFGVFEVALTMFDGYQDDPRWYKVPLTISCVIAAIVMLLIVGFVYYIEQANPIMALLPFLSAAGAGALAFKRAHARRQNVITIAQAAKAYRPNKSVTKSQAIVTPQLSQNRPAIITITEQSSTIAEDPIVKMHAARQAKIAQRRDKILHIAGTEQLSIEQMVERLKVSDRIIRSDLKALQADGHSMSINGVVKLT